MDRWIDRSIQFSASRVPLDTQLSIYLSEDLWVVRREEQRTKVARVGLAQLQAAERCVEQRRYFGGEATTVQARIRRLVRGRVRGVGLGLGARVRVGLGLGRGCRGRSRGYPRGEASIGRLCELQ